VSLALDLMVGVLRALAWNAWGLAGALDSDCRLVRIGDQCDRIHAKAFRSGEFLCRKFLEVIGGAAGAVLRFALVPSAFAQPPEKCGNVSRRLTRRIQ